MAQTAVDWLFTTLDNILELYPSEWEKVSKAVEQAKAMEKEQIIDSAVQYLIKHRGMQSKQSILTAAKLSEQYYNEIYESK
jgi:hypothetical protein